MCLHVYTHIYTHTYMYVCIHIHSGSLLPEWPTRVFSWQKHHQRHSAHLPSTQSLELLGYISLPPHTHYITPPSHTPVSVESVSDMGERGGGKYPLPTPLVPLLFYFHSSFACCTLHISPFLTPPPAHTHIGDYARRSWEIDFTSSSNPLDSWDRF